MAIRLMIALGVVLGSVLVGGLMAWYQRRTPSNQKERDHSYKATFRDNKDKQRVPPEPPTECAVCLDRLVAPIELLPCGHIFHRHCLTDSLRFDRRCPQCRYTLIGDIGAKYKERLRH